MAEPAWLAHQPLGRDGGVPGGTPSRSKSVMATTACPGATPEVFRPMATTVPDSS
jgi:hypothetical protein